MIDRLEELLDRVEDTEREREPARMDPALTPLADAGQSPPRRELTYMGAGTGLPQLYRQLARTAEGERAVRGAGVTVVREETPAPAALTAEGLDLAMRRDSRRYDSGMTIY